MNRESRDTGDARHKRDDPAAPWIPVGDWLKRGVDLRRWGEDASGKVDDRIKEKNDLYIVQVPLSGADAERMAKSYGLGTKETKLLRQQLDRLALAAQTNLWALNYELRDRYPIETYPGVIEQLDKALGGYGALELFPGKGAYFLAMTGDGLPLGGAGVRRYEGEHLPDELKTQMVIELFGNYVPLEARGLGISTELLTAGESYGRRVLKGTVMVAQTGKNQPEALKLMSGQRGWSRIPPIHPYRDHGVAIGVAKRL